jgi:hypothetical protein
MRPSAAATPDAVLPSASVTPWPWILLPARFVLFAFFQLLFAGALALTGSLTHWNDSGAWWTLSVALANIVCLFLLTSLYRLEGKRYWDIFRIDRDHLGDDLLVMAGLLVITGPIAMFPNSLLATALFGDPMIPMRQFLAPLPGWAIYAAMVAFPITQGLTELPFYFLYIMPRLGKLTGSPWTAYALASLALGVQHAAAPLMLDGRFFLWRALMFIPFALMVGIVLKWRPRLMPYFAIVHVLIDFATTLMYMTPF